MIYAKMHLNGTNKNVEFTKVKGRKLFNVNWTYDICKNIYATDNIIGEINGFITLGYRFTELK